MKVTSTHFYRCIAMFACCGLDVPIGGMRRSIFIRLLKTIFNAGELLFERGEMKVSGTFTHRGEFFEAKRSGFHI